MTEDQHITIEQTVNKSVPTPTRFLTLGLTTWIIDIYVTKFIGIDTVAFASQFTIEKLIRLLLNGLTILFLILYALNQKRGGKLAILNIGSFMLLEAILFTIISFGGITGGNINHIFMGFYAYFFLIKPLEGKRAYIANITFSLILFLDYFFLNWLYHKGIKVYIIPIWFFIMLFLTNRMISERPDLLQPSKLSHLLTWSVIGLLTFYYAGAVSGFSNFSDNLGPGTQSDFQHLITTSKNNMLQSFFNIKKAYSRTRNKTLSVYTEEYYTGEIDAKAKEDLGVFIDDLKLAAPEFYSDEPVSLWATLVVKTLDDNKRIDVTSNCTADINYPERKHDALTLTPKSFTAIRYDEVPLDCTFNAYTFRAGIHTLSISTLFNFRTRAYQKKYFINKDRAYALKRQELEPLEYYGIDEKEPPAVYTAGPVMVGMNTREDLISIDPTGSDQEITIGITIDNKWSGKIKKIDDLTITIPSSMQITDKCSGYTFEPAGTTSEGNSYKLVGATDQMEFPRTFRCLAKITSPSVLLGEAPLSIRYFKADITYTYIIKKDTSVNIRDSNQIKEMRIKTTQTTPTFDDREINMQRNDVTTIDLSKYSSDKETPLNYLTYRLSTSDKSGFVSSDARITWPMVDCRLTSFNTLECKSNDRSGQANLLITVDDLSRSKTAVYRVCVDTTCVNPSTSSTTSSTGSTTTATSTTIGPSLIDSSNPIPGATLNVVSNTEYRISLPTYIHDDKTKVQDMTLRFPSDDPFLSRTITLNQYVTFSPKNDQSCVLNHPYTFTAEDSDGNKASFTLTFNIEGCT